MKLNRHLIAIAALSGAVQMLSAADITGKITLKGTPPPNPSPQLDATCGKMHPEGIKVPLYLVGAGGALEDVFVYIKEGAPKGAAPTEPAVLDQKGCEYIPYVSGLQTGQKLLVKNSDTVLHNVHAMPIVAGNKEANRAELPNSKPLEFDFANPEVLLRFKCDVHPWMFSYVGVVDHPYFAVTDKDGNFKIANVPAGSYTVEAYHRKAGKSDQKVTVGADGAKANFTLEVPK
jgi:hypothetical protein